MAIQGTSPYLQGGGALLQGAGASPLKLSGSSGSGNGVYWIGTDGKVWVKGSQGTNAAGMYDPNSDSYWSSRGFAKIADPNPGSRGSTVVQGGATYSGAPKPVYAPSYNIAGANATARQAAEGAVNPYYTKALNSYLEKAALAKQTEEYMTKTAIQNYEDQLKQTLEQNDITGKRTTEDVATNEAQIARTADEFQTDSGQAFDAARIAEARRASVAGTTGGTAAQNQESLQAKNATIESRQATEFKEQKDQQELFKNRTFEDIARSSKLATTTKEKGTTQAKFDLDTFIKNQALDEKAQRDTLEKQRQEEIAAQTKTIASRNFYDWLNTLSNPQALAAAQRYGSAF